MAAGCLARIDLAGARLDMTMGERVMNGDVSLHST